jgi:hypothetical protein
MSLLIANFDKEQYIRPLTFGPNGAGGRVVVPVGDPGDLTWARLLLALPEEDIDPPLETWAGDRVAGVKPRDESTRFLTAEDVALYVLAHHTEPSLYEYVLNQFTDVTALLLKDGVLEIAAEYDWFERIVRGYCLRSLTPHQAKQFLAAAAGECGAYQDEFLKRFASQPDVRASLQRLAMAQYAALEQSGGG